MATGAMVGFLRTFPAGYDKVTDIIPADYTVNGLIGVMWDTVNRYTAIECLVILLTGNIIDKFNFEEVIIFFYIY